MGTNNIITIANCADGTHDGNCTFIAAQALGERYLLVSLDSGGNRRVKPCGEGELPIGVATDEAEVGGAVNVHFIGGSETILAVAAESITAGTIVTAAENGRVCAPANEGEHYLFGIAIGSALGVGERIEILPYVPSTVVIED